MLSNRIFSSTLLFIIIVSILSKANAEYARKSGDGDVVEPGKKSDNWVHVEDRAPPEFPPNFVPYNSVLSPLACATLADQSNRMAAVWSATDRTCIVLDVYDSKKTRLREVNPNEDLGYKFAKGYLLNGIKLSNDEYISKGDFKGEVQAGTKKCDLVAERKPNSGRSRYACVIFPKRKSSVLMFRKN